MKLDQGIDSEGWKYINTLQSTFVFGTLRDFAPMDDNNPITADNHFKALMLAMYQEI